MPKAVKWEEGSEKYEGAVEATWMGGEGIMDMREERAQDEEWMGKILGKGEH
jgi:hypothetical protein